MKTISELVEQHGGIREVAKTLTARGVSVSKTTVHRWCQQGRIPTARHAYAFARLTGADVRRLQGVV